MLEKKDCGSDVLNWGIKVNCGSQKRTFLTLLAQSVNQAFNWSLLLSKTSAFSLLLELKHQKCNFLILYQ
jgi:hypothetical protein